MLDWPVKSCAVGMEECVNIILKIKVSNQTSVLRRNCKFVFGLLAVFILFNAKYVSGLTS